MKLVRIFYIVSQNIMRVRHSGQHKEYHASLSLLRGGSQLADDPSWAAAK